MGKALHAELQKARRRHDLLICLAVPVVVYLWAGAQAPTGADELANAYSALLYALPLLNAILMPIVMAVSYTHLARELQQLVKDKGDNKDVQRIGQRVKCTQAA